VVTGNRPLNQLSVYHNLFVPRKDAHVRNECKALGGGGGGDEEEQGPLQPLAGGVLGSDREQSEDASDREQSDDGLITDGGSRSSRPPLLEEASRHGKKKSKEHGKKRGKHNK